MGLKNASLDQLLLRTKTFRRRAVEVLQNFQPFGMGTLQRDMLYHLIKDLPRYGSMHFLDFVLYEYYHILYKKYFCATSYLKSTASREALSCMDINLMVKNIGQSVQGGGPMIIWGSKKQAAHHNTSVFLRWSDCVSFRSPDWYSAVLLYGDASNRVVKHLLDICEDSARETLLKLLDENCVNHGRSAHATDMSKIGIPASTYVSGH